MKVDSRIRLSVQEFKTLQKASQIAKKIAIYAPGLEDASLASSASGVWVHLAEVWNNENIAIPMNERLKTAPAAKILNV